MGKAVLIGFTLFLFAGLAAAQIPTAGNVFFGYSYYNTNLSTINRGGLNGWEGSLEGKVFPFLGIVADISGSYGSLNFPYVCATPLLPPLCLPPPAASVSVHNVVFGPRVSAQVGRYRPFAEAMVGVGHVNADGTGSDTSFATTLGGGLDYRLVRLAAWRFQADYVQTRFFGATQSNVRLSTGIVLRF
jgi:hypothetical protein